MNLNVDSIELHYLCGLWESKHDGCKYSGRQDLVNAFLSVVCQYDTEKAATQLLRVSSGEEKSGRSQHFSHFRFRL